MDNEKTQDGDSVVSSPLLDRDSLIVLRRADVVEIQSLLSWLRHRGWKVTDEDDKETVRLMDVQLSKALAAPSPRIDDVRDWHEAGEDEKHAAWGYAMAYIGLLESNAGGEA